MAGSSIEPAEGASVLLGAVDVGGLVGVEVGVAGVGAGASVVPAAVGVSVVPDEVHPASGSRAAQTEAAAHRPTRVTRRG